MKYIKLSGTFGNVDGTLSFSDGLNVFCAPNESGKSTWCALLRTVLYGISTSERPRAGFLPDKTRFLPWSGKPLFGSLTLEKDGRTMILERSSTPGGLFKVFSAIYADSGVSVPGLDGANAGNKLIGVGAEVFTKTLMCQGSVMALSESAELERRIFALSGGGEEEGSALEADARLAAWGRERNFNNRIGSIPRLSAEIAALERGIESAQALNKEEIKLKIRISELERDKDEAERLCGAFGRMAAAQRRERALEAKKAAQAARAEFENYCAKETIFDGRADRDKVSRARERFERAAAAEAELKAAEAAFATETDRFERAPARRNKRPFFAGLFFTAVALILGIALPYVVFYAIAGGLLLASSALLIFTKPHKSPEARVRLESAQAALHLARTRFNTLRSEAESAALALGETTAEGLALLYEKIERAESLRRTAELAAERAAALEASLPKEPDAPLSAEDEKLLADGMTEEQSRFNLSEITHEYDAAVRELARLEGRIASGKNITELAAALDADRGELAAAEFEFSAISAAREALSTAAEELSRRMTPSLNARAAEIFTGLTGDRYDRLTVGRGFETAVSPAGGALVPPVYLSSGAYDLLYLSLRLALSEMAFEGELPPLILDDICVMLDDERAEKVMELLAGLAASRQIILFTCRSRDEHLALAHGGRAVKAEA